MDKDKLPCLDLAEDCIKAVYIEGQKTHKPNEWKSGPDKVYLVLKHLDHAFNHISRVWDKESIQDHIIDVSHAAARTKMALQLLLEILNKKSKENV